MIQINSLSRKKLGEIGEKYQLSLILAFGSHVESKNHPHSDLDIGVLSRKELDFEEYSKLYSDLSEVFAKQNMDLVLINQADPLFLKQILKNCQLLYGSKRTLAELKIFSFKRYCDYQPYLDLERKFVHQFIREFK